jgi:hypothetical protein
MRIQISDMPSKPVPADIPKMKSWGVAGPEWGGHLSSLHRLSPGFDAAPALRAMPGGVCPIPHAGYCIKGVLHVSYADGTREDVRAGDMYYMQSGHTFTTDADAAGDCELIELTEVADVVAMQQAAAAASAS